MTALTGANTHWLTRWFYEQTKGTSSTIHGHTKVPEAQFSKKDHNTLRKQHYAGS